MSETGPPAKGFDPELFTSYVRRVGHGGALDIR
jgi:hypothetical protein